MRVAAIQLIRCFCKIHVISIVLFPLTPTFISAISYDSLLYSTREITLLNYIDLEFG